MEINKNEKTIVVDLKDIIIFLLIIVIIVLIVLLNLKNTNKLNNDNKKYEKNITYENTPINETIKENKKEDEDKKNNYLSTVSNTNLKDNEKNEIGWKMVDDKWHYYSDNGEMAQNVIMLIGGKHYYFDSKGVLKTNGWFRYKKSHYYAREDGSINYDMIYETETEIEETLKKETIETNEIIKNETTENKLKKEETNNLFTGGPKVNSVEILGPGEIVEQETLNLKDKRENRISRTQYNYEIKEIKISSEYKSENENDTVINISLPELYKNGEKDKDFNERINDIRNNILDNLYMEIEGFEDNEDYIKSIEFEKNELTYVSDEEIEITSTNEYKTKEDKNGKITISYQYDFDTKDIYYEIVLMP